MAKPILRTWLACLSSAMVLGAMPLGLTPPSTALAQQAATGQGEVWQAEKYNQPWRHVLKTEGDVTTTFDLALADKGRVVQLVFAKATPQDKPVAKEDHIARVVLSRDKDGGVITATHSPWEEGKWARGERTNLTFWPSPRNKKDTAAVEEDGIAPRTWRGQTIPVIIEHRSQALHVWVQGRLVATIALPQAGPTVTLQVIADTGDSIANLQTSDIAQAWRYQQVPLAPLVNADTPQDQAIALPAGSRQVPFQLTDQGKRVLDLIHADWVDGKRNPASYYSRYDSGPYFLGDDRQPMVQIPKADYVAAHVIAWADSDQDKTNTLTLRTGRYNTSIRGQVIRYDFTAQVPRSPSGSPQLQYVRVDMSRAFAQDIIDDVIDVEMTKEIRLARRTPDPNRFRWRAQGLPSGVKIAAITFEKSPLQVKVTSKEEGHLFVEPQQPSFDIELTNISPDKQDFTLQATATYVDGSTVDSRASTGSVEAGKTASVSLPIPATTRGYYEVAIKLLDGRGQTLLERHTTFAILPELKMAHHDETRIGVWDFSGGHLTPNDPHATGPIYQKLGLRYGMFNYDHEIRAQYDVRQGREFSVRGNTKIEEFLDKYKEFVEKNPDAPHTLLIFHEDSISGPQVTRVPDIFTDRPAYELNEAEQKRWDAMYELATTAMKQMRAHDPSVQINIGNGPVPLREQFYKRGLPAELFDNAGNEAGVFGRPPESQPPDIVANNASIWMDRQLLDHYGYEDKGIAQCFEITYPSTNPGNLSLQTQAAYFVRHALHGMGWDMPQIRMGSLTDMGNSYYFSNWGSSGIMTRYPDVSPKPAAVALSTLIRVMDGATFKQKLDMNSDSLYGQVMSRKDGKHTVALWTIHGRRPVTFTFNSPQSVTLVNDQGVETPLKLDDNKATVTLTGSPCYLIIQGDAAISAITPGEPEYDASPRGQVTVVDKLDSLDGWSVNDERSAMLEAYNPFDPRRKGDFRFSMVEAFQGRENVVQVKPMPIDHGKATMAMYSELQPARPIELPGEPTELGLWVNGNGSWGRIIFQLTDAKGQKWTSIGAPAKGGNPWLADWLPKDMLDSYDPSKNADWNTNDAWGLSRISFDGWRYVGIPLPGQFPGNPYPWPANSQWRFDQDGIVAYPLKLTGIVVQLPEKTLHVKDYAPVRRPEIYLSNLVASQEKDPHLKTTIAEYQDNAQVNGL